MNQNKSALASKSGISIIEVLIALALLSIGISQFSSFSTSISNTQRTIASKLTASGYKEQLYEILQSDISWQEIINNPLNTSFDCLKSTQTYGNCPNIGNSFIITNSQIAFSYDATKANSGLDSKGQSCQSFPSESCNMSIQVNWEPVCLIDCPSSPMIKINVKFLGAVANNNIDTYSFSLIRNFKAQEEPSAPINISFGTSEYVFWEDAPPTVKIYASSAPTTDIDFELCTQSVAAINTGCGGFDSSDNSYFQASTAVIGEHVTDYQCHPFIFPAGSTEMVVPSYSVNSSTVTKRPGCVENGAALYELQIKNLASGTSHGINKVKMHTIDKTRRYAVTSVTFANDRLIVATNYTEGVVFGHMYNSKHEPICGFNISKTSPVFNCGQPGASGAGSWWGPFKFPVTSGETYQLCTDDRYEELTCVSFKVP